MPKHDMQRPCTHCPFRTDGTAIRFQCKERAQEIAFSAYVFGFPCHTSAEYIEDDSGEESGYVFTKNTQHCAGYIIMQIQESKGRPWPGINFDQQLLDRLKEMVDFDAPVFRNLDSFYEANDKAG